MVYLRGTYNNTFLNFDYKCKSDLKPSKEDDIKLITIIFLEMIALVIDTLWYKKNIFKIPALA